MSWLPAQSALPLDWTEQVADAIKELEEHRVRAQVVVLPWAWREAVMRRLLDTEASATHLFGLELSFGLVENPVIGGGN